MTWRHSLDTGRPIFQFVTGNLRQLVSRGILADDDDVNIPRERRTCILWQKWKNYNNYHHIIIIMIERFVTPRISPTNVSSLHDSQHVYSIQYSNSTMIYDTSLHNGQLYVGVCLFPDKRTIDEFKTQNLSIAHGWKKIYTKIFNEKKTRKERAAKRLAKLQC